MQPGKQSKGQSVSAGLVTPKPAASSALNLTRSWGKRKGTIGRCLPKSQSVAGSITERRYNRNGNEEVIQAAAETWAEKGEQHRSLVHGITTAALKKVAYAPPPLESWSDIEKADRAGRRSCGLDDSERNQTINIGMQMVEARLINLSLPPDALPVSES